MKKNLLTLLLFVSCSLLFAQTYPETIYKGSTNKISWVWGEKITAYGDTTINSPFEGSTHYLLKFTLDGWWAGGAFNINNWGWDTINASGATHIVIATKGSAVDDSLGGSVNTDLYFTLEDTLENKGEKVLVGNTSGSYEIDTIAIANFVGSSSLNLTHIKYLNFEMTPGAKNVSGSIYIDNIEFIKVNPNTGLVTKLGANKALDIFPNPASEKLSIQINENGTTPIAILNMLGEEVINLRNSSSNEVDTSVLASGSYVLMFSTASGEIATKKIIIK